MTKIGFQIARDDRSIGDYGEKVNKDTGMDFRIHIGLNSGPVIVGSIGDDLKMDYTAINDTTNPVERLFLELYLFLIVISINCIFYERMQKNA